MRRTVMMLFIICMLAVFLTGCTGANNVPNTESDMSPYVSPYVTPYTTSYGTTPPGYGGDLVSPIPTLTQ